MTDLRQAAQQALDALNLVSDEGESKFPATIQGAISDLEAALAQQAEPVEPVAWMVYTEGGTSAYVTDNPTDLVGAYRALPLYATPPQRKLVLLTAQELDGVIERHVGGSEITDAMYTSMEQFARAVERAHGIKE